MAGSYTLFGWVRLAWELTLTRLFYPRARLMRRPIYLRGVRHIDFGRGITIGRGVRIEAFSTDKEPKIVFGDSVEINDYVHIAAERKIVIGNRVLIASRVFITDHNHGSYGRSAPEYRLSRRLLDNKMSNNPPFAHSNPDVPPADRPLAIWPVVIEDNVWLGEGVCVMPGVTIGAGSIIGANAVVTSDIPPASVAVGIPARVIRTYDSSCGWIHKR